MAEVFPTALFVRGKETSDEDPWDDTLLIKQYDESVNQLKQEVAKSMEVSGSGEETTSSKGKSYSPHKMKKKRKGKRVPPEEWDVGSFCRAKYSEDGKLYEGQIIRIDENAGTCTVRYIGYGNEEDVFLDALLPTAGRSSRKAQEEEAMDEQLLEIEGALDLSDCGSPKEDKRNSKVKYEPTHVEKRHGRRKRNSPETFLSHWKQSNEDAHGWTPQIPPPPPPPPHLFEHFSKDDSEALSAMLMSWYMSGYHTGYYYGLKQARSQQSTEYGGHRREKGRKY